MQSLIIESDPCGSTECLKGEACRIFPPTGEAYCDPDCSVENGGCEADQKCIQALALCSIDSKTPCPGFVTCVDNTSELICNDIKSIVLYDLIVLPSSFNSLNNLTRVLYLINTSLFKLDRVE